MLEFLQPQVSHRKLQLFACVCCRDIWLLLADNQRAIEVAEQAAEGQAAESVLSEIRSATEADAFARYEADDFTASAALAAAFALAGNASLAATNAALADALYHYPFEKPEAAAKAKQAARLRHIIGNPFRPSPPLSYLPSAVRDLAEAVYRQEQAAVGPLHDALLDAGLTELADHFTDATEWHPKGCWAIDVLTGRA
jgi:hypothetical protein